MTNRFELDPEAVERGRVYAEVTFHKLDIGSYEARVKGKRVGEANYTGSHLDDYPWDWLVDFDVKPREGRRETFGPSTHCEDTLRACKESIRYAWYSRVRTDA